MVFGYGNHIIFKTLNIMKENYILIYLDFSCKITNKSKFVNILTNFYNKYSLSIIGI